MAKDKYHELVKQALIDEGWTITDDPLPINIAETTIEIDLAAEKLLLAKKGKEEIAIEIKSFLGINTLHEFYKALGQFRFYQLALRQQMPEKHLYLAIPLQAYKDFFARTFVQELLRENNVSIIVYNVIQKNIEQWIKDSNTGNTSNG